MEVGGEQLGEATNVVEDGGWKESVAGVQLDMGGV